MKSRIIALFTAIVIMISCFGFVSVQADEATALEEKYTLVTDLGITAKTQGNVTRGEFCTMLVNTINYNHNPKVVSDRDNYPFEDVTPSDSNYDAISYLRKNGLINGYNANIFLPEREITLSEAVTIIMRHLRMEGETDESKLYTLAAKYKLLKDIDIAQDGILDVVNAKKLIYNLIHTDISNSLEYYYEDEKYFYRIMGLDTFEGVVTDDGICSISGESQIDKDEIIVSGEKYINASGKNDIFTYEITGYYKLDSAKRKIAVSVTTDEDSAEIYNSDSITSYKNYVYTIYNESGKTVTKRLSSDFTLIYNGRLVKFDDKITDEVFARMMQPDSGSVMLVGTSGSRNYNIVKVKSYHNMVVGSVIKSDDGALTIINKFDTADRVVVDKNSDLKIVNSVGSVRSVDSIIKNTPIAIAQSYDKAAAEIILSSSAKSGTVEQISEDLYTIEGDDYELSWEYKQFIANNPQETPVVGQKGKLYLTFENKVLYFEADGKSNTVFALFGEVASNGFDYEISFYTEDNNFVILNLGKQLKIDSISYKAADAKTYLDRKAADLNCTLVRIRYDDSLCLTELDIPYLEADGFVSNGKESADSLHYIKNLKDKECEYDSWLSAFQNQVCITDSSLLFYLPKGKTDIRETRVITQTSKKYSGDIGSVPISAFSTKEDGLVAEAMLVRDVYYPNVREPLENNKLSVLIVKDIRQRMSTDGTIVAALCVTDGYYETTYTYEREKAVGCYYEGGETKRTAIEIGDIIKIGVDDEGVIPEDNIMLIYDCSEEIQHYMGPTYTVPNSWSVNNYSTPSGYITRKTDGYIEFTQKDPGEGLDYNEDAAYVFSTSKAKFVIVEKQENRTVINYSSMADVISYKESPIDYDKNVIISNKAGDLLGVFVYR